MAAKIPYPEVVKELITHLKTTGTGQGKLDTLHALSCPENERYCSTLSGFLARCRDPKVIPEGTMHKIDAFFASRLPPVQEPPKPAEETANQSKPEDAPKADDDEVSDVANLNAEQAKDAISRMRSGEKLQHIIDNDDRKTVKEAATKRLEEIIAS